MEKKLQNPIVICVLALLCCALWGSAFPCIKIGYEWMEIEGIGSQILFAGYRFFLSGVLTFALGCLLERRILRMKRENFGVIFRQGVLQTTIQYVCFYIGLAHTTGAKGSIINASNAFVSIVAAHYMIRSERMTWKKVSDVYWDWRAWYLSIWNRADLEAASVSSGREWCCFARLHTASARCC